MRREEIKWEGEWWNENERDERRRREMRKRDGMRMIEMKGEGERWKEKEIHGAPLYSYDRICTETKGTVCLLFINFSLFSTSWKNLFLSGKLHSQKKSRRQHHTRFW